MNIKPDDYFEKLMSDEKIGKGTARCVYAVKCRKDVVIKKQRISFPHSNMVEWIVWGALKKMGEDIIGNETNKDLQGLFAECFEISETGKYLMMERLEHLDKTVNLDLAFFRQYPSWFNDKKRSAFGESKTGAIKIMDYGMINFYEVLNPKNCSNSPF